MRPLYCNALIHLCTCITLLLRISVRVHTSSCPHLVIMYSCLLDCRSTARSTTRAPPTWSCRRCCRTSRTRRWSVRQHHLATSSARYRPAPSASTWPTASKYTLSSAPPSSRTTVSAVNESDMCVRMLYSFVYCAAYACTLHVITCVYNVCDVFSGSDGFVEMAQQSSTAEAEPRTLHARRWRWGRQGRYIVTSL